MLIIFWYGFNCSKIMFRENVFCGFCFMKGIRLLVMLWVSVNRLFCWDFKNNCLCLDIVNYNILVDEDIIIMLRIIIIVV